MVLTIFPSSHPNEKNNQHSWHGVQVNVNIYIYIHRLTKCVIQQVTKQKIPGTWSKKYYYIINTYVEHSFTGKELHMYICTSDQDCDLNSRIQTRDKD